MTSSRMCSRPSPCPDDRNWVLERITAMGFRIQGGRERQGTGNWELGTGTDNGNGIQHSGRQGGREAGKQGTAEDWGLGTGTADGNGCYILPVGGAFSPRLQNSGTGFPPVKIGTPGVSPVESGIGGTPVLRIIGGLPNLGELSRAASRAWFPSAERRVADAHKPLWRRRGVSGEAVVPES